MKRILSITLGSVGAVLATYLLVGEYLSGTSSDATINARTSVLRAPIEGEVEFSVRNIGARVASGETVARIADRRFDTARLIDLERGKASLEADLKRNAASRAAMEEARATLQAQARDYQEGRVRQIAARIGEARAAEESAEARLREAESAFRRTTDLNERGLQTAIQLDKATADVAVARQELERSRQRSNFLQTELASARNGVYIGDSYNDAPFSIQRTREIDLRLSELAAEAENLELRLRQAGDQISAERVRVTRLTSADLNAAKPGLVWNFRASSGEHVNRGQDLVTLVDCSTVMVTASVTESVYSTLRIGMPAQFRVNGDSRVFEATITRLAGAGAAGLYDYFAVGASPEHLTRFDVTLAVPALAGDPDLACAIGRTGRVVFTGGPLTGVRHVAARFGF